MSHNLMRHNFGKLPEVIDVPNLIEIQIDSYNEFLQKDIAPEERETIGLQAVFHSIFPIRDPNNRFVLDFVNYVVGEPKYTIHECQERDMSFSVPLKATLRLTVHEFEDASKEPQVKDIIEQQVYLGELPLITERGTFIINGAERVIISQLHRSPGVVFDKISQTGGRSIVNGRIIPHRGSWLEFIIDGNDYATVLIDNTKKINLATFLRAIGFESYYDILDIFFQLKKVKVAAITDNYSNLCVVPPLYQSDGIIFMKEMEYLTDALLKRIKEENIDEISVLDVSEQVAAVIFFNTFLKDVTQTSEEALNKFYTTIRPGNPANLDSAKELMHRMFFNPKRYDLGDVGRFRLNTRLDLDIPEDQNALTNDDIISVIKYLVLLWEGRGYVDDIDHLGNRRVRSVGELVGAQFTLAFTRMARTIREKMSLGDITTITPQDLISARTINSVLNTFFGSSQLSQFMDQTNPLSEMTHKRRLSALGPGGLTRERAGFEVRDVHQTHYGRICPIETPEGQNIGLISSMCVYTKVNKYGFLETPYRRVMDRQVINEIVYLSAHEEERFIIAQANAPVIDGYLTGNAIRARKNGEFIITKAEDVDFIDLNPKQIVSVAAALIPFLEHDDANRALMGSNMQRQAVPLIKSESPIVGTGMEWVVARDSGSVLKARSSGRVEYVSSNKIIITPEIEKKSKKKGTHSELPFDVYDLTKFKRTNQDTCISQRPIVSAGDQVDKDQIIADGSMTDMGELALGRNVMVALMPWNGYNFEDAIILSERLVREDVLTSVHISEYKVYVRDTKRGREEITRELPNISELSLSHLDKNGIVKIGSYVKAGDILVGKVTPKGETELTPEEKLLRAIFGEKARDVKDTSMRVPPGVEGIVIDTKVFSRREHSDLSHKDEREKLKKLEAEIDRNLKKLKQYRDNKVKKILLNKLSNELTHKETEEVILAKNTKLTKELLSEFDFDSVSVIDGLTLEPEINNKVIEIYDEVEKTIIQLHEEYKTEQEKILGKDELPPGILQLVKVYIAQKRKIQVGDKMAGRHGNKGVVARIVPDEDMPFLQDGTHVDVILNPLGVPSRMNIGQLLEAHLGWAASRLNKKIATPVFDGASINEVKKKLEEAGLPSGGKVLLFDGLTGEPFRDKVTVGNMYMLKLYHMVDDKIHARSIGPYSLVTQQPLGGKAQFGGQRLGEMEVWALEAYGAAYCLQEMLTVKSDDVLGRSKIYESIVKGENPSEPGVPESFNGLIKELQALALDVKINVEEEDTSSSSN